MKKLLAATALATAVLVGPATTAYAQDDTTSENEDDDSGKLGLIGLAGLLGLAGLARRDRNDRYDDRTRAGANR
jgi:MYXO-CTERM domain-containing protein